MAVQRISLLTVPVDVINPDDLEKEILALTEKPGAKQIVFLSLKDLLFARINSDFMICLQNADLVLPVSKSIISGASFLKLPVPFRYNPFNTIISILSVLDKHYKTLYLLGNHKKSLMQAEQNIHSTFSGLRIVGRHAGYNNKTVEKDVVSAIYKASPAMVLLSNGIKGGSRWVYARRNSFSSSIFLYRKDILDIFSNRKKNVSEKLFSKGLEFLPELTKNPFKLLFIFPYLWYKILLLVYRITSKN